MHIAVKHQASWKTTLVTSQTWWFLILRYFLNGFRVLLWIWLLWMAGTTLTWLRLPAHLLRWPMHILFCLAVWYRSARLTSGVETMEVKHNFSCELISLPVCFWHLTNTFSQNSFLKSVYLRKEKVFCSICKLLKLWEIISSIYNSFFPLWFLKKIFLY